LAFISFTILCREVREFAVFKALLKQCPGLQERLLNSHDEEIELVADLVSTPSYIVITLLIRHFGKIQKGMNGARADDTKGMKVSIVDWITSPGQSIEPAINRKIKTTRGFHHERTGALLCPAGYDWTVPQ
jgi:hypothetical protein